MSQSNREPVKQYIADREEHRRKIGFQDESRALLRRHEIGWDENCESQPNFHRSCRTLEVCSTEIPGRCPWLLWEIVK